CFPYTTLFRSFLTWLLRQLIFLVYDLVSRPRRTPLLLSHQLFINVAACCNNCVAICSLLARSRLNCCNWPCLSCHNKCIALTSLLKPMLVSLTSFAAMRRMRFCSSLRCAYCTTSFVSAAKPIVKGGFGKLATLARMSGFLIKAKCILSWLFFILLVATSSGR